MRKWFIRLLPWCLTALCMYMIMGFSSQTGETSASLSGDIAALILRLFSGAEPDRASAVFARAHLIVRKLAHISEYFVLATLFGWALSTLPLAVAARYPLIYAVCFTFAFLDEWLQTGVSGRAGRFEDVLIDTVGTALAMLASFVYMRLSRRGTGRRA